MYMSVSTQKVWPIPQIRFHDMQLRLLNKLIHNAGLAYAESKEIYDQYDKMPVICSITSPLYIILAIHGRQSLHSHHKLQYLYKEHDVSDMYFNVRLLIDRASSLCTEFYHIGDHWQGGQDHFQEIHMTFFPLQDNVLVLAATHRYKQKYVTTLMYKPVQNSH